MTTVVIDMEFAGLPWDPEPDVFWVGLADTDGRTFSAVNADIDTRELNDFTRRVVVPKIPLGEPHLARVDLAQAVKDWVGLEVVEWWAWMPTSQQIAQLGAPGDPQTWWHRVADWDFQLLQGLIDPWPRSWAGTCHDLGELSRDSNIELPTNTDRHHPASDAAWGLEILRRCGRA